MRNPKWHRDEIILALDLYFHLEPGKINSKNPDVQNLSRILNQLPIHEVRPDQAKFRNANGVGLKLSNFLAIDPEYLGKGMQSYSQLDKLVFDEFANDTKRLQQVANNIRIIAEDLELANQLYLIQEDLDDASYVSEGAVIYKLHKYRERDQSIIRRKKAKVWDKLGKLLCESCSFDFHQTYGELGKKYIECHHRIPLSSFSSTTKTTVDDLSLVCSNCHRMLHRDIDNLTVEGLKQRLAG